MHRLHRRDRRGRPPSRRRPRRRPRRARADAEPAARRDGRLRDRTKASSSSPRPTVPTCSIRRCCVPAASIAASSSTVPTSRAAKASSPSTPARSRWPTMWTCAVLARGTAGFSGADLANLVNEAALNAARYNQKVVRMHDFEFAKDKVLMGSERRSMIISDAEKTSHGDPRSRPRAADGRCCRTPIRSTRSRSSRAAWRSASRSSCRPTRSTTTRATT